MGKRLGARWWLAVIGAFAVVTVACGDDDDSAGGGQSSAESSAGSASATDGSDTTEASEEFDPDAVVLVGDGLSGTAGGISWDPLANTAYSNWRYMRAVYGSLLLRNPDGSYRPDLATDWRVVDPQTVELDLREGVTFTDGTPFNADAVRSNILRAKGAAATSFSFSDELKYVADVEVVDEHQVRITLSQPVAGWLFSAGRPFFSSPETLMPSPAAAAQGLDAAPIGAGPFEFVSYTPDEELVLTKSESYWDADNVTVGGVRFVSLPTGPTQVTGLSSGDVDITNLPSSSLSEIETVEGVHVESEVTGAQFWAIYLCKNIPPFDDPLVRRAISYAIDREAIADVATRGAAEPATGVLPEQHRFHVAELDDYYAHDPDEARRLLAEAGASNVSFNIMLGAGVFPGEDIAEIIRSQLTEVGVTMNPVPVQNVVREFFAVPGAASAVLTPGNDYGITDLTPGGIGNACQYDNPELNALVADIKAAEPESTEQQDLIAQYQEYILDEALIIWLLWDAEVFAWQEDRIAEVDFVLGKWPGPKEILYEHIRVNP